MQRVFPSVYYIVARFETQTLTEWKLGGILYIYYYFTGSQGVFTYYMFLMNNPSVKFQYEVKGTKSTTFSFHTFKSNLSLQTYQVTRGQG
ncbi:hypothetical protein AAHA92_30725 [Salvia divinorum]|uniref:Uncharacterized protein n=1 Tax=Salvia divinorum TaxID=28513 RepID=A0ABD1FV22_SALDI